MLPKTFCLFVLIAVTGLSWSSDPVQVISGVFMPSNISLDYDGARTACALQNSRLATLDNVTFAFRNGYEMCRWGWIEEKRVVMLRLTPFAACSDSNVGILMRDCPGIRYTFCVNSAGNVSVLPIPSTLVPSYENASSVCTGNGLTISTQEQIVKDGSSKAGQWVAWYNWGVGRLNNGTFEENFCDDTSSYASAFCYNPALSDVLIIKDNQIWKKIAIGCIIAFIFVILLLAATFMRGNKCVCCMGDSRTQTAEIPSPPAPTWNTTSIYRRISHANKGAMYDNVAVSGTRPPVIRPEMSHYKNHYSNMGFDTTED